MPELPEVYTITSDLKNNIIGYKIKKITKEKSYSLKPDNNNYNEIIGYKISDVNRLAKNIIIEINKDNSKDKKYIIIHLAMTGRVLLRDLKYPQDRWTKVIFTIENKSTEKELRFTDMRMFGKVVLVSEEELKALHNKYGPEPLDENISDENDIEKLCKTIQSKNTTIKNALLDQSIISGLGNIYATDTLFISKINPKTKTNNLSKSNIKTIITSAKEILNEGIKNRGSTLEDKMYVDIFGKSGNHQKHFKIYGKKTCPECNTKVEFEKINGRGTYYCPKCQILIKTNQSSLF